MCHIQARPTRFLIASLALLAAAGCGDSTSPGDAEDPGLLLVPTSYHGAGPVWTRDGTEVLYVLRTTLNQKEAALLRAVNPSTRAVRELGVFPPIGHLVRSTGGERIYFGNFISPPSGSVGNYQVSRVHPTSGLVEIVAAGDSRGVAVSGDERLLAVGRRLYDLEAGTTLVLPAGAPIDFSPDGTQLLYSPDANPFAVTLISTADGSSQPLHSDEGDSFIPHIAHRWEGNSPKLLRTDHNDDFSAVRVFEIDGVTGATQDIAQFRGNAVGQGANWSPDGNVLAMWIATGAFSDEPARKILYLIRPGNAPEARANVAAHPGQAVFSPNGNSIAYFNRYGDLQQAALYLKSGI